MAHEPSPHAHAAEPGQEPGGGIEHPHPTWGTYFKVAAFLTIITIVEVWVYYIPPFVESPWFVPSLLIMSAVKFATVVMFYMHLKYDARLFRALFTGPLIIAVVTIIALIVLFATGGYSRVTG